MPFLGWGCLKIEVGSWNLICRFSKSPKCAFWEVSTLFVSMHPLTAPKMWLFSQFSSCFEFLPRIFPPPPSLGKKVEIWYVNLVLALDALFGEFNFSTSLHSLTTPNKGVFCQNLLFFEFILPSSWSLDGKSKLGMQI